MVSEQEWAAALRQPLPELRGFLRAHIDLPGLRWHRMRAEGLSDRDLAPFDAGHDVFADGSLLLLPTPGHTPGPMSLLVRRPGHAPLLLVGDLIYDADLLAAGHVPGAGDKAQMRKAVADVNALRQRFPALTVLAAHDPAAADRLATPPGARP
ncbi:MAG: MBL fold metallo-hydrolase [Pseudonocardiaceae bacterium]